MMAVIDGCSGRICWGSASPASKIINLIDALSDLFR
jgi:hypothetical protein